MCMSCGCDEPNERHKPGDITQEELEKAVADALTRGMVRKGKLADAARADPSLRRLAFVLAEEVVRVP